MKAISPLQLLFCLCCIPLCQPSSVVYAKQLNIGALFEPEELIHLAAFTYAMEVVNKDKTVLGQFKLNGQTKNVLAKDSFAVSHDTCELLLWKSVAIFGPTNDPGFAQAKSICDSKEIPQMGISWNFGPPLHSFSVDIYPPPRAIGKVVADMVKHFEWNSLVLVYQDDKGLVQLQDLFQMSSNSKKGLKIAIRRLPLKKDFRPILKEIKEKMNEFHIILQANLPNTRLFMDQAVGFKMFADRYHYVLTDLDVYTLDLETYKQDHNSCNISGIRLVDVNSDKTAKLRKGIQVAYSETRPLVPTIGIQTDAAIIFDAVQILSETLHKFQDSLVSTSLSCDSDQSWHNGSTVMNFLRMAKYTGTTGTIEFDSFGHRINYEFTVVELTRTGFDEFGRWNESKGLTVTKNFTKSLSENMQNLENRTLNITVMLDDPFVMLKQEETTLQGNDRFEGFCIDLLNEVAQELKFNYTLKIVNDNSYGTKDDNGKWTGMVGELLEGKAHLAVSAFTISYSRSEAIDFTVPFMHLGISILFKKPDKKDPGLFTFLSPLSLDVWIYMIAAYVGVSLMLWILARFSPYEWYNPHPCNPETEIVENQFSLLNSLWFTVGSLMQQGSDIAPKAVSTRLVAGIWWFFTLILISSYTANLAAFLTVERMVSPIESADDLAKQTKIRYGTLDRGSTKTFFKESKIQTYERMWAFMESAQPSVFVNSSKEGINRVKTEDYAYLMESSMLEYYVERDCNLTQIGSLIDSKGYGIGLPKGSPYRDAISSAILLLQEKTRLTALKQKWWKQKRGGGKCKGEDANKGMPGELGLANVGGVFVVLLGGLSCAFIISIIEFCYKTSKQQPSDQRGSLCAEMCAELRFAAKCHGSKKPVKKFHNDQIYHVDNRTPVVPGAGPPYMYTSVPLKSEAV